MRPGERDADDGNRKADGRDDMPQGQPPAREQKSNQVADRTQWPGTQILVAPDLLTRQLSLCALQGPRSHYFAPGCTMASASCGTGPCHRPKIRRKTEAVVCSTSTLCGNVDALGRRMTGPLQKPFMSETYTSCDTPLCITRVVQ